MASRGEANVFGLSKPPSARERIYLELRARLQRCEFGPNDRLVDIDVAARFGTSRMPVREALLQLVNEGYLTGTSRGFMVPVLSLADMRDSFEVRRLIEPRAAANAARDLDAVAATALEAAALSARAAVDAHADEALIQAMIAFRAVWLGQVRNARLASTIGRFADHVQTVRLATLHDSQTQGVATEGLEQLCAAFLRRDALAVGDRMTMHIATAERAFFALRSGSECEGRIAGQPISAAA
jgi:DNA-binding GntR family transcriptional regulator